MDSDTIREEKQSGEARRMNKVLFWVVFFATAGIGFFLAKYESFFSLIFFIAAVITAIVAFIVKIRRYVKEGKYYDFSNGSWLWSAVSEGYIVVYIVRFIVAFLILSNLS
jgi:hypothetical protein